MPVLSVVTPSFNQAAYLEQAMLSVLSQDYPAIEYIVVDGGSSDGSQEIIKRYAERLAWWTSEPDDGQTDAINKGFARATGDIMAYLNSDDLYRPGAVREAVDYLVTHPEIGMVYGDADYIDENGTVIGRFAAAQTDYKRLRRGYVHIPQQAAFFRADLWRRVGPLDPSFQFAMDYDLWVRISALAPIHYVRRPWAAFRLHDQAKTRAAIELCWPEMIRVHRRLGGSNFSIIYAKYLLRRLLLLGYFVPGMLVLSSQWIVAFWMARGEQVGILLRPLEVETAFSKYLAPKIFLSIVFPLTALLAFFGRLSRDRSVQLGWLALLMGAPQMYLLAEGGDRFFHGNLRWGAQIGLFLLFAATGREIARMTIEEARSRKVRLAVTYGVYVAHVAAGVAYYLRSFASRGYG